MITRKIDQNMDTLVRIIEENDSDVKPKVTRPIFSLFFKDLLRSFIRKTVISFIMALTPKLKEGLLKSISIIVLPKLKIYANE